MSIHSAVHSNITDPRDLIALLDAQGIPWENVPDAYDKATGQMIPFAIEAVVAGDRVMAYQTQRGAAIVFQSAGWWFRNKNNVAQFARQGRGDIEQARERQRQTQRQQEQERQQRAEQRRIEEEQRQRQEQQRRQEEERQRREAAERRRQDEERQRREAAEREERERLEEERRQRELAAEAQQLAQRFSQPQPAPSQPQPTPPPTPPPAPELADDIEGDAAAPVDADQMDNFIGRLHQENARRKVLESIQQLEEQFGLHLHREDQDDDETYVLTLRG